MTVIRVFEIQKVVPANSWAAGRGSMSDSQVVTN